MLAPNPHSSGHSSSHGTVASHSFHPPSPFGTWLASNPHSAGHFPSQRTVASHSFHPPSPFGTWLASNPHSVGQAPAGGHVQSSVQFGPPSQTSSPVTSPSPHTAGGNLHTSSHKRHSPSSSHPHQHPQHLPCSPSPVQGISLRQTSWNMSPVTFHVLTVMFEVGSVRTSPLSSQCPS